MVTDAQVTLEVERVMNLVRGFGWVKAREEMRDGTITICVVKTIPEVGVGAGPGPG